MTERSGCAATVGCLACALCAGVVVVAAWVAAPFVVRALVEAVR